MVNLPCCVLLVLLVQRQIEVFSGLIWVGMELKRQLKFCAVVCVTLLPVIGESWEAGWLKPDRRKCSLQKINKTADMQETQENCRNKESRNSNKYRKIHPKEKKKGKPAKPKKKTSNMQKLDSYWTLYQLIPSIASAFALWGKVETLRSN